MKTFNLIPLICFVFHLFSSSVLAQYQAEATFDDQDDLDSTPEVNNLETGTNVTITFSGNVRRSEITEGKYGRGADFYNGAGSIHFNNYQWENSFIAHFWTKLRNLNQGNILMDSARWRLYPDSGVLFLELTDSADATHVYSTNLTWPDDDLFHHLTVKIVDLDANPLFIITLDFNNPSEVQVPFSLATSANIPVMGQNLDGIIDEVILANGNHATLSAEQDRFNLDPDYCPEGVNCIEDSFILVPRTFTHEVPVRFKFAYDPLLCSESNPCPLLFAIQGGSACNNDYTMPADLVPMTLAGFIVVTIDPYCEGEGNTYIPETEVSQFIAVKNYIQNDPYYSTFLRDEFYSATGCSHGAIAVLLWAMREEDHPFRTFGRSAELSGHCPRVAGKLCAYPGGTENLPFDIEGEEAIKWQMDTDTVAMINSTTVSTREIARSWGANLEGPICPAPGESGCKEEGYWGMTYGSRRFKTVWQYYENEENPSGYFVEDIGADCRHCAPPDSIAFTCGLCFLYHGRKAMEIHCPKCLNYEDETIQPGPPGEECPLEASWYEDPLTRINSSDAGVDTDADDCCVEDVEEDNDVSGNEINDKNTGCNCNNHLNGHDNQAFFYLFFWLLIPIYRFRQLQQNR